MYIYTYIKIYIYFQSVSQAELCAKMLAFEPGDRPSAEEALKHVPRPSEQNMEQKTRAILASS